MVGSWKVLMIKRMNFCFDLVVNRSCVVRPYGGVLPYANYVAYGIKKWIDEAYRTIPDSEHTAIVGTSRNLSLYTFLMVVMLIMNDIQLIGSSHGGLAAFHIAMSYPERFGIGESYLSL